MNRIKIIRRLGIIAIVIIFGLIFYFIIFPMMVLAPNPASLLVIANFDDLDHIVDVEIYDSDNISLFNESYHVKANDLITIERGFDWIPKYRFWWLSWEEGSYTFNVSLDNEYNMSHFTELYPSKSVWIQVYLENRDPLEIYDTSQH